MTAELKLTRQATIVIGLLSFEVTTIGIFCWSFSRLLVLQAQVTAVLALLGAFACVVAITGLLGTESPEVRAENELIEGTKHGAPPLGPKT